MSRLAITAGTLALATFFSASASAQTIPGLGASAGVSVGIPAVQIGGQISIGVPAPAAPAPAPVYMPPQRPAVRYYEPAPRPVRVLRAREPFWGAPKVGLDLRVDGAGFGGGRFGDAYGMGGAGLGLRFRAAPHLGFEAGLDVLGGHDYNANRRVEVAGSAGAMLFFNPRSRAQLYLSGGMLLDHARATDPRLDNVLTTYSSPMTYNHLGGYAGLGLEFFLSRHVSLHVDGRGVVRQKIGGTTAPEFTDVQTGRTTNTSAGFVGSAGLALYF